MAECLWLKGSDQRQTTPQQQTKPRPRTAMYHRENLQTVRLRPETGRRATGSGSCANSDSSGFSNNLLLCGGASARNHARWTRLPRVSDTSSSTGRPHQLWRPQRGGSGRSMPSCRHTRENQTRSLHSSEWCSIRATSKKAAGPFVAMDLKALPRHSLCCHEDRGRSVICRCKVIGSL